MAEAVRRAAADAGLSSVPDVDSIRVVQSLSHRYRDPARFVAAELGITAKECASTTGGGNTPQSLVNLTSLEMLRGEVDLVVLTGGEAWRTRRIARAAEVELWEPVDESVTPDRLIGGELTMTHPAERAAGIMMPVQIYPMFETALRAARSELPAEHLRRVAQLWSRFAAVAANNPHAWVRSGPSAEDIATPGPSNRMIGLPYPKMMNSNNDVDQGAAVIMCTVEKATSLGIARDRWVFPHSGTDCHEHYFVSNRLNLAETPAIALGGRLALELAGVTIDDIEVIDLYSCFPSAVQLGAASLGISTDRQLTRTGGLSFAGGPWNNYVMHSIATVMADLRDRPGAKGLVWANGGYVTKHAFGIYSTEPPAAAFQHASPQDEIDAMPQRELAEGADAAGTAIIEAFTVMHSRDGAPETAFAACLLPDRRRAWGRTADPSTVSAMTDGEWVGRSVRLDDAGELHV